MRLLFKILNFIFNFKGWMGEQKTTHTLSWFLDDETYNSFHDVILPSVNGTAQIDHILVSAYGVFIVETKNKAGWIFGSVDQEKWTQIIFKKKYTFQNPLRQTYRQKKVLAEFLGIDEGSIYPLVYFVGESKFKTQMPSNVINSGLAIYIKNFKEQVFSSDDVNRFSNQLQQHLLNNNLSTYDHVLSLNTRLHSKTICPKCGGNLISRTAKQGKNQGSQFLGCTNYPNCRFTRST